MNKITKYFRGVGEEARRIRWPNQRTLWRSVAIVLTISIVSSLAILFSDWIASEIMKSFEEAFPKPSTSESASDTVAMLTNAFHAFKNGGLF